jgi:hypothetical protein
MAKERTEWIDEIKCRIADVERSAARVRSRSLCSPGMTCIQRMRNAVLIVLCYKPLGRQQYSLPEPPPELRYQYSGLLVSHGPCRQRYRFVSEGLKHRAERSRREDGWCKPKERGISPVQPTDLSCFFPFLATTLGHRRSGGPSFLHGGTTNLGPRRKKFS